MAVVINEFEVVPEERGPEAPAAARSQQPQSQQAVARQIEATLRTLLARRARLRAT